MLRHGGTILVKKFVGEMRVPVKFWMRKHSGRIGIKEKLVKRNTS